MSIALETIDAMIHETVQAGTRLATEHPRDWAMAHAETSCGLRIKAFTDVRDRIITAEIRALKGR